MAINWPDERRAEVTGILSKHMTRCQEAANEIWPHAIAQDGSSRRWKIVPAEDGGWYVSPKQPPVRSKPWDFHVVVEAECHCVDVLTRTPGWEAGPRIRTYLDKYYNDPNYLAPEPWDGSLIAVKG
jgi:hypothetical protein